MFAPSSSAVKSTVKPSMKSSMEKAFDALPKEGAWFTFAARGFAPDYERARGRVSSNSFT